LRRGQAFTLLDLLVGLCCLVVIVTVGWTVFKNVRLSHQLQQ